MSQNKITIDFMKIYMTPVFFEKFQRSTLFGHVTQEYKVPRDSGI